ncbi:MAG: hypothetical protein HZB19_11560 [Chloroflexi bacterium]|nr:hypothetical protein [Chloroflexota bacterium]
MSSEEKQIIQRVVERYIRTGSTSDDQVNVTCLPVDKTSYVERIGEDGRIILLDEYRLDGKVIWASYSTRSETVYLSLKSTP